jgi:hypothetical protein
LRLILGYELLFLDAHSFPISHSMHPVWSKFPAIQFAMTQFPSAEWIWWLDMDALIMTPWIDLRERLLFPDGMAKRLLNKTRVVANKRIKTVEGEETPELVVDEVSTASPLLPLSLFSFLVVKYSASLSPPSSFLYIFSP